MHIAKRFGFYGFGFVIGLLLLFFFLNGKKAGCDYGPDARTLKNIKIKQSNPIKNGLALRSKANPSLKRLCEA